MNVVDASRHFKRAADRVPTPSFAARYLGRTVLAIGAHPDDIELGIGGTVALLANAGIRVISAIVSVPADYELRSAEAKESTAILGGELRILLEGSCRRIEDLKLSLIHI